MIVTKDYERLYLDSWEYNASLIISELAKIVENHGGRVKPMKHAVISNRSIDENKRELEGRLNRLQQNTENFSPIINDVKKQLEELEKINNEPITVTHTSYITFVLDKTHYYYGVDSNPFFEFYYHKVPIVDNQYSRNIYASQDPKKWLYDCFLYRGCSSADIREAANLIFNMLMKAPYSKIYHSKSKRFEQIDF